MKSLQPDCLLTDHTHLTDPVGRRHRELRGAGGRASRPPTTPTPATQEQKINASGGNDWFWAPNIGGLMSVVAIVDRPPQVLEPRWTNFLLNCPPNRDGLLDAAIVTRLGEVGAAWSPNASRPPLPAQGAADRIPVHAGGATATSGTAANAIDGINDNDRNTIWRRRARCRSRSRSISAQMQPDVGMLGYVPEYVANVGASTTARSRRTAILTSTNGTTFTEATSRHLGRPTAR